MKNAIRRNITSGSSEIKKAFSGLWKYSKYAMVKAELGERANLASEFAITDENIKKEIAKQKNWTAPRMDGIQNFW